MQAKVASRRFVVYVEVTQGQPDDLGLVRLLGTDPTEPGDTSLMLLQLSSGYAMTVRGRIGVRRRESLEGEASVSVAWMPHSPGGIA